MRNNFSNQLLSYTVHVYPVNAAFYDYWHRVDCVSFVMLPADCNFSFYVICVFSLFCFNNKLLDNYSNIFLLLGIYLNAAYILLLCVFERNWFYGKFPFNAQL